MWSPGLMSNPLSRTTGPLFRTQTNDGFDGAQACAWVPQPWEITITTLRMLVPALLSGLHPSAYHSTNSHYSYISSDSPLGLHYSTSCPAYMTHSRTNSNTPTDYRSRQAHPFLTPEPQPKALHRIDKGRRSKHPGPIHLLHLSTSSDITPLPLEPNKIYVWERTERCQLTGRKAVGDRVSFSGTRGAWCWPQITPSALQ